MPNPFDPITINGLQVRNRFQRSATWDASATDDGEVTDDSLRIIGALAKGGVGLVVTGYAYVSDEGKAAVHQYGIPTTGISPAHGWPRPLRHMAPPSPFRSGTAALTGGCSCDMTSRRRPLRRSKDTRGNMRR
jgi:hypothetical protein